jgi:hypothetical protein
MMLSNNNLFLSDTVCILTIVIKHLPNIVNKRSASYDVLKSSLKSNRLVKKPKQVIKNKAMAEENSIILSSPPYHLC